ncbi:radical SAM/SPASM domain-containing protein [Thiospirillum jenense]|uniref:SPASM domain-containing protein n=1 Tax=Thiospirillum jenense TaxID=1653858 RepID=A0A839HDY5_9GAMM|nr:radical SAM protein [Thiospirillum jenense]MBB1125596.1 SPASM domain-containing protein [Thiospirillum jenense]
MLISKFSHTYERNGITAFINSLRLNPVYLDSDVAKKLLASIKEELPLSEAEIKAKQALLEAKYFVEHEEIDQKVLHKVRSQTGKPELKIAYFIVTDECNFDCTYCFIKRDMPADHVNTAMSKDTVVKCLDFFEKNLVCKADDTDNSIIIYGGEPLLEINIALFIAQSVTERKEKKRLPENLRVSLITNGSLLSKANAILLKNNDIAVSISLDGDEVATNSCRHYCSGKGVYGDVLQAIAYCKEVGLDFSLSVTITESLLSNPKRSLDLLVKDIGVKGLGFNILMYDKDNNVLDDYPERAARFILDAFTLFREQGIYEDRIMRKLDAFCERKIHLFDCAAAGGNQVVFSPDGSIGVCHGYLGTRNNFIANVNDIDKFDLKSNDVFLEWSRRSPINMKECLQCAALGICGGGCPFNAEKENGSIWTLDSRFCAHSKLTLEWLIWDLYHKMNTTCP